MPSWKEVLQQINNVPNPLDMENYLNNYLKIVNTPMIDEYRGPEEQGRSIKNILY